MLRRFFRNFGAAAQYNLILLLFLTPALLWTAANIALLSAEMTAGDFSWALDGYSVLYAWLLGMIPLWGVAEIGGVGAAAVFCRIAEGKDPRGAFLRTMKRRTPVVWLLGTLRGALLWMLLVAARFYGAALGGASGTMIQLLLGAVLLAAVSAGGMLLPAMTADAPWKKAAAAGVRAGIRHLPLCLLSMLVTAVLPAAALLIPSAGAFVWSIYYMVFGLSAWHYGFAVVAVKIGLIDEIEDEN